MKKILITPRAFAKSGREVIRELEKKGYSVIFNDTGKSYSPEVFLNLAERCGWNHYWSRQSRQKSA